MQCGTLNVRNRSFRNKVILTKKCSSYHLEPFWSSTFPSEKLKKAATVDFKKTPRTEGGDKVQGRIWCRPKVPDKFAFPGAPNPRIYSISRFGKIFPEIVGVSSGTRTYCPTNSHSLLEFSDFRQYLRPLLS